MRKMFHNRIKMESNTSRSPSSSETESYSPERQAPPRQTRPRSRSGKGRGRSRSKSSSSSRSPPRARGGARGGPRGRGRRRAQVNRGDPAPDPNRADEALIRVNARQDTIDNTIDALEEDKAKDILKQVAARDPALILDLLQPAQPQQGYHPPAGTALPDWCVCTRCRDMPTDTEKVCCGHQPNNCLSTLPDFFVIVLDEGVLAVAQMYRRDFLAVDENRWTYNDRNRHAAYRQFILWQHGRLGAGHRRVIPSCCVWAIRDEYPEPMGQYTGFTEGRLG